VVRSVAVADFEEMMPEGRDSRRLHAGCVGALSAMEGSAGLGRARPWRSVFVATIEQAMIRTSIWTRGLRRGARLQAEVARMRLKAVWKKCAAAS